MPGLKSKLKTVLGGSLGGNMSLRIGRSPSFSYVKNIIPWSPASIWASLADGADSTQHGGVRAGWHSAGGNALNLPESVDARRQFFADAFDKSVLGGIITPPQAHMWFSKNWPCAFSVLVGARLDRHETYNRNFRLWHWRLGTEQLIFSHATLNSSGKPLYTETNRRTFLMCGRDDDFSYTNICSSTKLAALHMTTTQGKALFLDNVGHSIDAERPAFFARKVVEFLTP
jgi:pimeloyl-ACP methyl ester carboxylesterase